MDSYRMHGRVVDAQSKDGIGGLRIEAWDKDFVFDDFVGSAVSAADGSFEIRCDAALFDAIFLDRRPDLYFKLFRGQRLLASTEHSVVWNAARDAAVTIEIDANAGGDVPPPPRPRYVVFGTVTGPTGTLLADAQLTVHRERIRSRQQLATGRSAPDGSYRIEYVPPAQQSPALWIVVEADSKALAQPLRSEPAEAKPELQIDLSAELRDTSELGVLVRGMTSLADGLPLTDLVESEVHHDLSFIARELGRSPEDIMRVALALRLEASLDVPAAVFYAFLRQRAPAALPDPLLEASDGFTQIDALVRRVGSLILAVAPEAQTEVLVSAVALHLIAPAFASQIPALVARLQALRGADQLDRPFVVGKTTLRELLDVAQLPAAKQQTFSRALIDHTGSMRAFWRMLGDGEHGFTAEEASAVERTLSVGAFVKNHQPLLTRLLGRFASGQAQTLPDLARIPLSEWIELVRASGAPPSIDAAGDADPAEVFARVVHARVSRAYPTVALSSRAVSEQTLPDDQLKPLARFFANNPELELVKHNVARYLEEAGEGAFKGIELEQRPAVLATVRSFQRVLKVAPSVDGAASLLGMGVDSAQRIATLGEQQFFLLATEAGVSKQEAQRMYRTGVQRYAGLTSLYAKLNRDLVGIWPKAVGQVADRDAPITEAIDRDQSLATLFGSQDYCAVDGCTSVLAPAAYVCDLLLWLRNHPQGEGTALDELDARRPDIRHLLLNCPNTNTALPYIDLVNELLADEISPPLDPNSVTNPRWKQTSEAATPAQLRAAPEYFNQDAYVVLSGASYPHTLPYSAGLDELRSYLAQSKVPLWQLRQWLLPLHTPSLPQRAPVAAERFGMTPEDAALVSQPNHVAAEVAWNIANPEAAVASVPAFMRAAALEYRSLLELLEVRWVQGGLAIAIEGIDDRCDTSTQSLAPAPLDPGFLDRAHRFLRAFRRTGYEMWELDLLLLAPSVGNGVLDAAALVGLHSFSDLQRSARLRVDELLAFYQDLDTSTHLEPDGERSASVYARVFLNPAVVAIAPDPDLEAIAEGGVVTDPSLTAHGAAIQAALGLSAADTALFVGLTDDQLNLGNLSFVYRASVLAKLVRLSVADAIALCRLLAPAATSGRAALDLQFGSTAATARFLQLADDVRASGFSIDALSYLLTPPTWTTTTQMTDADIASALEAVRQAILNPSGGDVDGSVIAAMAASAHRPSDAPIANDASALLVAQLQMGGKPLLGLLTDAALTAQPGGAFTAITRANFPNQFLAVQLFDKAALVVRRLRLVAFDLGALLQNPVAGLDFLALPVTAGQPALALDSLLTTLRFVQLARLFTSAPPAAPIQSLYDLVLGIDAGSIAAENAAQAALATLTGWSAADIATFAVALGTVFPADYASVDTYEAFRRLASIAAATFASGAQVVTWGAAPADELAASAAAADALRVLKARYPNESDWLALAPEIMNPIRERRSAALKSYLCAERDAAGELIFGDTNGLFDRLLIDVEMSACETTTRVIQAYVAIQLFVERCLMNLEAPQVVVDLARDDTWTQWEWMKRYRIWQANREVFLYPENWLIEAQRPNRTETFKKLEQDVQQNESTRDYLETVVLSYIDGLDALAHLRVTGTCRDTVTGAIHVVARSVEEPPAYYHRALVDGAWTGWERIPLDIKAHHVVPGMYRNRLCLFWLDVKALNEPHQMLPSAQPSSSPPSQEVEKYVTLTPFFSTFRNQAWSPALAARGKLFDRPLLSSSAVSDFAAVEALYTIKLHEVNGAGASLFVDVFRLGTYIVESFGFFSIVIPIQPDAAVQIGRGVFDGRFSDLELRNMTVWAGGGGTPLLQHAQAAYGPDAQPLLPLPAAEADPDIPPEPGLVPLAGALATSPAAASGGGNQTRALTFTSVSSLEQNVGALLNTAPLPFRVVGPSADLSFDPTSYFFYQDNRRAYYVESQKNYCVGSRWTPVPPSNPGSVPFEVRYVFHRFYHPFTKLLWHQLGSGGFPLLYSRGLQLDPDRVDPSGADAFSFQNAYQPVLGRVSWDRNEAGEDREFLDFTRSAPYSTYNWELFFHIPLYVAESLSRNQKFEDALEWFHYIFNPTLAGAEPAPQRFWITKPFYKLTSSDVLAERINELLVAVNNGDPEAIAEVRSWRRDPFNPFLLADQRPVSYMKRTVMSYLDCLIAWADNLFATDSREALSEATLLYVIAAEILGAQPTAIVPPQHANASFDDLEPHLDAFANALVDVENSLGGMGGGGGADPGGMLPAHTFFFKVPPNDKLLGYWKIVADRLFKLRHCQNISGVTRQLALFDAPIDPGLLVKARAAGVDIGSVLSDVAAPLPNYRFSFLYSQALDFLNAVRAYGSALLSALEKSDSAQLSVLQQTLQRQLLRDGDQILQWQMEQAANGIENVTQTLLLAQSKYAFNSSQSYMNAGEVVETTLNSVLIANYIAVAVLHAVGAVTSVIPHFMAGAAGFGGSPTANAGGGGDNASRSAEHAANAGKSLAAAIEKGATLAGKQGGYAHRKDAWDQAAAEAQIQIEQANVQLASAQLGLQIAQQNITVHDEQVENVEKQLEFLNSKFTAQELYDWHASQLATTYFQSYRLAYRLCKQVERCYQFELGIEDSSFIQFGYWDSLRKGLLAGETLSHDLRRMQASYLELNERRFEVSRFISLAALDPNALEQLLVSGACDFDVPESLFDNDYPGHYNRRLQRVSVTVVYPSPGKFDNVKATLTLVANKVRTSSDISAGYAENPPGADPRFVYNYAAVPQKIVLGNAQDDPGLFVTSLSSNLNDQRYLPFEQAGAVSSWHFEMPSATNEIDVGAVGDVILHFYYTALDGGDPLKTAVSAENAANAPSSGIKVFSAINDFDAPAPTAADPSPPTPWKAFLAAPPAGTDQTLTLSISSSKFPAWTRGKTIRVTQLAVIAVAYAPGSFSLAPQPPLAATAVSLNPVPGGAGLNVCSGLVSVPANTAPGTWTFKLRKQLATDFRTIRRADLADVLVLVSFQVS